MHPTPRSSAVLSLVPDGAAASFAHLVQAAQEAETQGRRGEARELYERALVRLPEAASGAEASSVLRWIARTYRVDSELELALDCAAAALAVAEAHADDAAVGHATNLQAIIHVQQGDLDRAEQLYHSANESALRADETKLSAMITQNLGVIANIRGDLDTALGFYQSSLAAYRRLGLAADVCVALNNLGLLHTHRRQWSEALCSYDEAMCLADALGDQKALVQIDVNRAECLVAQGRLDEARTACERATERSGALAECAVLGELHKAFGIVERELGNEAESERHLGRARTIATQRQNQLLLAESLKESAELHRRQGRNRDTLQCLNQAHRLFAQLRARLELADVGQRLEHLESDFLDVVRRWGESIESKDEYTQGHCERVADMACALARQTGMDEQSLFWFRIGALLHDVGKLVIPAEVLNKAGALTPAEWELVRHHPTAGVEMLKDVEFPWDVTPIVESHHERWDGRGYPHGAAGESIPMVARILCIADVYDALTSQRSYKKPMSHTEAMDLMRLEAGKQFDPALFTLFEEVAPAFAEPGARHAGTPAPRLVAASAATPAQVDDLTGLPQRRALVDAATAALRERGGRAPVSMLVLDVDHFKQINDTHGHLCGDAVLRLVASTLREQARPGDLAARFAGDEFVLLLPDTAHADARAVGERLRAAVQALPIVDGRTGAIALTVSIGVATAPEHGATADTLFARADAALFQAKRRGRDAVCSAEEQAAPTTRAPRLDHFVGRQPERRQMIALLDAAVRGDARVLTVAGEPGVGKSAFARQLVAESRLRAASLVSAHCHKSARHTPFQPWATLLDAVRVLRIVPDRRWRALGALVPALADAGGAGERPDRGILFGEVVEFLRLATHARPLVVLVDDAHWADRESAELIEYVVEHLHGARLLFCLTLQPEEMREESVERRRRVSRNPRVQQLALRRLSVAETREWLAVSLGHAPMPALADHLHACTDGNPLFMTEFVRAMSDSGELRWTGQEWTWQPAASVVIPTVVQDLLARRIARLSAPTRRTLALASVMGRSMDIDLVVAAGVVPEDELLDAIEEGTRCGVIEPAVAGGEHRVSYAHPLLTDLLQQDVHPRRLRRMRDSLDRAIAERGAWTETAWSRAAHGVTRPLRAGPRRMQERDARRASWQ